MSQYLLPFLQTEQPATVAASGDMKPRRSTQADLCRQAAGQMQKHIDAKHRSADNLLLQPPTRRRLETSDSVRREAERLEKIQGTLLRLADLHERGTIAPELAQLTSRSAVERALLQGQRALHLIYEDAARAGSPEQQAQRMEREALLKGISGFFPTPPELASRLVEFASFEPGQSVFEPSAGVGSLIDAILQRHSSVAVSYCEVNCFLLDVLRLKYSSKNNVHFIARDFEELDPKEFKTRFDCVIMNPPFERGRDMEHVLRGYEFLAPGGVLAAIVSEGGFQRQDKKAQAFREFLRAHDAATSTLPSGSFKASGTTASCRLVRLTNSR